MPFEIMFGLAAAAVAFGFVTVISLVIYQAVRSARDPDYRTYLEAQALTASSRHSATNVSYNPALDPGNPASPMFPGNPGAPL